jgi:hypothetical protein
VKRRSLQRKSRGIFPPFLLASPFFPSLEINEDFSSLLLCILFYNSACCLPLVSYFLFVTHFIRSLSHLIPLILPHCFSFLSLRPLILTGRKDGMCQAT